MKQRIQTAIIMIAGILLILFVLPKSMLPYLMAIFIVIASWEWTRIAKTNKKDSIVIYLFSLIFYILGLIDTSVLLVLMAISALHYTAAILFISNFEKNKYTVINKNYLSIIAPILIATFASSFIKLTDNSLKTLVFLIIIVGVTDSGAYFIGRSLGKNKLCSKTSPKKTIEGLIGGVVSALIVSILIYNPLTNLSLTFALLATFLIAMYSVIGDLFESLIKRQNNIKDSSNLLPGHGGVLDRIDGLLPTLPIFLLILYSFGKV